MLTKQKELFNQHNKRSMEIRNMIARLDINATTTYDREIFIPETVCSSALLRILTVNA
jgi:hypothetical protein